MELTFIYFAHFIELTHYCGEPIVSGLQINVHWMDFECLRTLKLSSHWVTVVLSQDPPYRFYSLHLACLPDVNKEVQIVNRKPQRWQLELHLSLHGLIRLPVLATSVTCHLVPGTGSRAEQTVTNSDRLNSVCHFIFKFLHRIFVCRFLIWP